MVDSTLLIEIALVLIVIVCIVGIVVAAIYFWRKKSAILLSIEKDYRNPQAPKTIYYAIYNNGIKQYDLYTKLLSFKPKLGLANVDLKAFADVYGRVRAVRGVTGKPQDNLIVPLGLSLNSQAAANEYAQTISDGISARFQRITIVHAKLKDLNLDTMDAKARNELVKSTALSVESLKTIQQMQEKDVALLSTEDMDKFLKASFTSEWVMQKMGVRKVEDANIITISQKNAIASIGSRANEFISDHSGWWDKNAGIFIGLMCIIITAVSMSILLYGAGQYLGGIPGIVAQTVANSASASLHGLTNLTGVAVPKVGG